MSPDMESGDENTIEDVAMLAELIAKYKQPYIDEGYSLGETGGMRRIITGILTD